MSTEVTFIVVLIVCGVIYHGIKSVVTSDTAKSIAKYEKVQGAFWTAVNKWLK